MSNTKCTRGPWYRAGLKIYGKDRIEIADFNVRGIDENIANADLCVAATDLLSACKETYNRLSAWNDSINCWENQRALTTEEKNQKANYLKLVGIIERAIAKGEGKL